MSSSFVIPWTPAHWAPIHGISQVRILEWIAIPPPADHQTQGSNLHLMHWQMNSLSLSHQVHNPITIYCLGFVFLDLFFFLCFLSKEVPLAFVIELVWCCWILLTFAYLQRFDFLNLNEILAGKSNLGCGAFLLLSL